MSSTRPKRKATINKVYNDTIDDSLFDDQSSTASSSSVTTGKRKYQRKSVTPTEAKASPANSSNNNNKGSIPYNWQPHPAPIDFFSNKLDLADAYINLKLQTLYCPNRALIPMSYETVKKRKSKEIFQLKKNDYIYMISEPPGEPYYIGRIRGFTLKDNSSNSSSSDSDDSNENIVDAHDYMFQIQWFYRPRDISKSTSDSRLLFASMHSDSCPLTSFRGLVTVKHKQDIEDEYSKLSTNGSDSKTSTPSSISNLDLYTSQPNCFYFDKLFDRYMIKFYDILSTSSLLRYSKAEGSKSRNFLIALNKRFEFIFVESQRTKSLIDGLSSNSCNCEKCGQWCSTPDSVNCAVCEKYYHMLCLDPPLLKKPSRGFSWSCAPCTKKHDIEYQSKKMLMLSHDNKSSNEKELTTELSALSSNESEEEEISNGTVLPKYELMAIEFLKNDSHLTLEERRLKEEWCMRYLGMHARLEDGVDIDDKSPYPRASTRLGAKHQATNIPEFYGHSIAYYDVGKPSNGSKKKLSTSKKNATKSKSKDERDIVKLEVPSEYKDIEPKDYPSWLQPRPKGYIERGVDDGQGITCTLMWKPSDEDISDDFKKLDVYIERCSPIAEKLRLVPTSPNFVDAILNSYLKYEGDTDKAFNEVSKLTRKSLREPTFTKEEIRRFESGVKKYGSELYPVFKEVKTQPCSMIVRFYYLWKKTKNGKLIWGNFEGRMQKKLQNIVKEEQSSTTKGETKQASHTIDYLADPEDDSSYEGDKIIANNKIFTCKHCHTNQSIQWFRITGYDANTKYEKGTHEDIDPNSITGLCFRCARLWRRYAIVWEDPVEIDKRNTKSVGAWKKKIEYELVRDANLILNEADSKGGGFSYEKDESIINSIINGSSKGRKSSSSKRSVTLSSSGKKVSPSINKEENTPKRKKQISLTGNSKAVTNKKAINTKTKSAAKSMPVKSQSTKSVSSKSTAKDATTQQSKVKKSESTNEDKITKNISIKGKKDNPKESQNNDIKQEMNNEEIKRKRKVEEISDIALKREEETIKKEEKATPLYVPVAPHKRQKKLAVALSNKVINPIFNSSYLPPNIGPTTKIDRKSIPIMTKQVLSDIVENFRKKQLTDITTQLQAMQVPHLSSIQLPFETNDRKCCVCREHDKSETSNSDMLICSHCGVNVHSSCIGLSIPDQIPRPIKEWLCEACVNDLKPHHSTLYSCSLCLSNESNYELSILGSPLVRPDFLKPVFQSGKWCHLLCAIFNHNLVDFRPLVPSLFNSKRFSKEEITDQKTMIESIHNFIAIENISRLYLRNYTSKCGICNSLNGSLINCDVCESLGYNHEKYHVTCAQDTPNFKLGFKLGPQSTNEKDNKLINVDEVYGKLKPILVCPKHDQSTATIYNMRTLGKRVYGTNKDDPKPLIQLFLEDTAKSNVAKRTGPQFRSSNYIQSCKIFDEEERQHKMQSQYLKLFNSANKIILKKPNEVKICGRCETTSSPMWWIKYTSQQSNELENYLCQTCYHLCDKDDDLSQIDLQNESNNLVELLNKPLNGEFYGIKDDNDKLSDIYKPNLVQHEKAHSPNEARSRITIGDILS